MTQANETALIAALVAVARSMGADAPTVKRIRESVPEPSATALRKKAQEEVFLNTKQVMERLDLSKKTVLNIADSELGVVRHGHRTLRYPLSRILAWERGEAKAEGEAQELQA